MPRMLLLVLASAIALTAQLPVHISPSVPGAETNSIKSTPGFWSACGFGLKYMMSIAWNIEETRIVLPSQLQTDKLYDFVLATRAPVTEKETYRLVQQAIPEYFHITIDHEMRPMQVCVLRAPRGKTPAMKELPAIPEPGFESSGISITDNLLSVSGASMHELRDMLEKMTHSVVIDETGLGGRYVIEARGHYRGADALSRMLSEQIGLTLTRERHDVDILIVKAR